MSTHGTNVPLRLCSSTLTNGSPVAQNSFCAPLPLTCLESTLMKSPVSTENKGLTETLSHLESTLMKNRGEGVQLLLTRNRMKHAYPELSLALERVAQPILVHHACLLVVPSPCR